MGEVLTDKVVGRAVAQPSKDRDRFRPIATMPKDVPETKRIRWEKLAKIADRAFPAIELHCLDCVCWNRPEAADCQISSCSLWLLNRRIFKVKNE